MPDLEERVAALEAALAGSVMRAVEAEDRAAEMEDRYDRVTLAMRDMETPGAPLTPDEIRQLLRECVTVVKPGETLVVRVPWDTKPSQVMEYQRYVEEIVADGYIPFRVLILGGEELAVAEAEDA